MPTPHLHPDERFLTMVTQTVEWPKSVVEYLNPNISPLNPYNAGYDFFVYGTLPLKIVKFASEHITLDRFEYNNITLVGRLISTIFDVATIMFTYKIVKVVFNGRVALWSALFYALSTLPIQLSHFYAVDTFLVLFLVVTFYFSIKTLFIKGNVYSTSIMAGLAMGMGLASKISALYFTPIIFLIYLYRTISNRKYYKGALAALLILIFSAIITFRIADPKAFNATFPYITPSSQFVENIKQLSAPKDIYNLPPPDVQWVNTRPILFPFINILLWGMGVVMFPLVMSGMIILMSNWLNNRKKLFSINNNLFLTNKKEFILLLALVWTLGLFVYQGLQFVKAMRYFFAIYPFFAIIFAKTIDLLLKSTFFSKINSLARWSIQLVILILLLLWPLSFISIYSLPHSRVQASEWIYRNVPQKSTVTCEHWDDCLPLNYKGSSSSQYNIISLHVFDKDTSQKWITMDNQLNSADYIFLSSNRVWGSITKTPELYPVSSKFYKSLLREDLGFVKVAEFSSHPKVPFVNYKIDDSIADESFTVYDHPQVIILKKI